MVYVFTPNGDLKEMPSGATPVDFAYSIHTEVGHHCTRAIVNGKIVSLNHILKSGDTIEIITRKLLSYYSAIEKDTEPDYPRNLAKSVTVK